eukprot:Sdes_comp15810_c0_seq1m4880
MESRVSPSHKQTSTCTVVSRFQSLKDQFERGEITSEEYMTEKKRLLDELTGEVLKTSHYEDSSNQPPTTIPLQRHKSGDVTRSCKKENLFKKVLSRSNSLSIPPRHRKLRPKLPHDSLTEEDISQFQITINPSILASPSTPERALKHIFCPRNHTWTTHMIQVHVHRELLERNHGGRKAFHLQEISDHPNICVSYVAKVAIFDDDVKSKNTVCRLVEDRMYALEWAHKFNFCNPPKRVEFVESWLLELID